MSGFGSWGGYPPVVQKGVCLHSRQAELPAAQSILPYGLGRSYGDSCLNRDGVVVSSKALKNFIAFDNETGVLRCEAGVTLADIIAALLPQGWFLPVTPGTKYVTVGGAIANDVHGKNHYGAGSFGNYLLRFELLRSDGSRLVCSAEENADWYAATIGGLGLTGFITWAEIQMKPVQSRHIQSETIKYKNLAEFFDIAEASEPEFEYTAAWLDCLASGDNLGRGHFIRGNHQPVDGMLGLPLTEKNKLTVPLRPPFSLINSLSLKAFNALYYERQRSEQQQALVDFDPFFYPLDGILNWNRIYGKKGFLQHQCVIPLAHAKAGITELLERISAAGLGSFLVVLKMMGSVPSRGLLSFPQEGATLAMDFPFQGRKTLDLLNRLDEVVAQTGGRIYPAKDARMSAAMFQQAYPQWQQVEAKRDPNINSDFWRRVTGAQ